MDIAITSSPTPIHVNGPQPVPGPSYISYGRPPPATARGGRGRGRGSRGGGGQQRQRQVTPPFVYLQRPNGHSHTNGNGIGGDSPLSNESMTLPPNHIHIVQTQPQAQQQQSDMNRTSSTFSIISPSLPPLSNGPSSTEGSFGEMDIDSPYQIHQNHIPQGMVSIPVPIPIPNSKDPEILDESPIEHGSALQATLNFAEGLSGMKDGTFDEWALFIDEHFDPSARFQLQLISNNEENEAKMRSYDILASSLSRFFISLSENGFPTHRLVLSDISESPPSPESGLSLIETDQAEWHCRDRIWKGHLSVEGGIEISLNRMKIHRMELVLLLDKGDNIPENALRVLKMAEQMEVMLEVIDLTEDQQMNPNDALKQITESASSI